VNCQSTASFFVALLLGLASLHSAQGQAVSADRVRLGHRFEQLARLTLVAADQSHPDQLERAYILLDRAIQLDPNVAERWLLFREAAMATDRQDKADDAVRQYLRLNPTDDVAQLQMIDQLVESKQTADERLDFFTRIIEGPASKNFSAALRSRIAYRAAVLQAELGERERYTSLLATALQLDPTNKNAAFESYRVISGDPKSSAKDSAAALFTLFMADPTDPATHAMIADMQFARGFYAGAVDWYVTAERAQAARQGGIDAALVHNWAMALWGSGQSAAALQLLGYLDPPPPADGGQDPTEEGQPQPSAPLETLMLRAVIAASGAGELKLDERFDALSGQFDTLLAASPKDRDLLVGRAWAHLLCNRNIDQVAPITDQIDDDEVKSLLTGWLQLRSGETDKAAATLSGIEDPGATLGLGLIAEAREKPETAIERFRAVAQSSPDDIFGLTAVSHLRRLSVSPPTSSEARQIANLFGEIPNHLREMARTPLRFIQLKLTAPKMRYDYAEPIEATLEIRNVSSYPLGLGPMSTVPTRVLLLPVVRVNKQPGPPIAPIIIDAHRSLTLPARRSMSIPIRIDVATVSQVLNLYPTSQVGIDVVAVLNPRLAGNGKFEPGRLGSAVQVRNLVRNATPPSPAFVDTMIAQLSNTDPALVMNALGMIIPISQQMPTEPAEAAAMADRIIAAVGNVFGDLTPIQQAYAVTLVQQGEQLARRPYGELLAEAAKSDATLVQLALLATQVDELDSPTLNAALRRPDRSDPLRRFAESLRTAIERRDAAAAEAETDEAD
jgi:tetratricopeptide (TPR) repeat protein